MKKRKLEVLLLLLLSGVSVLSVSVGTVRPVVATCADVYYAPSTPKQMYAPVIIEIDFLFTRNANGHQTPFGFSKASSVSQGTTFLRFTASENDTYDVWFLLKYDLPVQQNITLTVKEGSRQPEVLPLCMNGQTAYFHWFSIQVFQEQHYPTPSDVWNYGQGLLTTLGSQNVQGIQAVNTTLFWIEMTLLACIVLGFIGLFYTRSVKKGLARTG